MKLKMSKKKESSNTQGFEELKKEIDTFKFQIDELCENDLPHLGAASPDRLTVYKRATDLKVELSSLNQKLNGFSLADAGLPTRSFELTKVEEKQRLNKLQKRLDHISEQLEPDEVEEEYFRTLEVDEDDVNKPDKHRMKKNKHDDDDDDDEDDDAVDNMTDEEESEVEEEYIICHAETLTTYHAEQEGDLSFDKGERLMILDQSEDGWWSARNKAGQQGVVPNTLIKIVNESEMPPKKTQAQSDSPKRSGKELWNILKEKKPTTKEASINEVLKAMKAVPAGFRSPTLGAWYQKDEYRLSTWVIPKTTPSKLQFRDLHWDGINKKLREHPVKMCRTFSMLSAKCIPPIGAGVEVLSRHVYIALWDEEKILSNIHLVRAVPSENSWNFSPKIGKHVPGIFDGEFVVRINSDDRRLSILFEFNYTYKRTSTSEQSDVCCGWVSLPLFEIADGAPLPNKTIEMNIHGGTPFEKDVPLDPSTNAVSETLIQSLIRSNHQPRLLVKSTSMNKSTRETNDMLPSTIIACQKYAPFIGFYRQHAATIYCRDDNIPSEYICDPLLSYFPRALTFPDLMDALKITWDEKLKFSSTRSQRKDLVHLQKIFKQSFTESAFGLMQCANIPPFVWGDVEAEKARSSFIHSFLLRVDPLGNLLSPDYRCKPLDISKLTFTVLSKHSVDPPLLDRRSLKT